MAAILPSLLMLWSYTTKTGLTVFTYLVALTVVTVAIPYLFSACAQLTYLMSRRRRVFGWLLARDLLISGAGVLFSMWVKTWRRPSWLSRYIASLARSRYIVKAI
jgi:APA family basic amino acid/polyamine antiporter